jgi:RpiB/LacA/LacB family sugar-phosphate isomerase
MRIAIGSDHAGFSLKQHIINFLKAAGNDVLDLGAFTVDPLDDYPDFAKAVGEAVKDARAERGVLICGSGVGASVAANKIPGIRAAMCHDTYSAHQGVEHDDMNVLVLGSRIIGVALAEELVAAYLHANFTHEERHVRRLAKVRAIENRYSCSNPP